MQEFDERPRLTALERRRRRSGPPLSVLALLIALVAAGGYGVWWLRTREAPAVLTDATAAVPDAPPADEGEPPLVLPALAASDVFVRQLAGLLSQHPEWAAWLVSDELVRRFVATVVDVARGSSPAQHLEFLAPESPFAAQQGPGGLVIAPATYRRYDLAAETFASLDGTAAARMYGQLHPLFEEAYGELGLPGGFDPTFARAVANLLAVRVPDDAVRLRPFESVYDFADPALQRLTPAEKHLLRMGPSNARRVQAKLREVAELLEVPVP